MGGLVTCTASCWGPKGPLYLFGATPVAWMRDLRGWRTALSNWRYRLLRALPRPTGVDPGHWRARGGLRAQIPFAWGPKQPRCRQRVFTTVRLPGGGGRAGPLEIIESFRFIWFCNIGTVLVSPAQGVRCMGAVTGGQKRLCWGPEGPWCSFGTTALFIYKYLC